MPEQVSQPEGSADCGTHFHEFMQQDRRRRKLDPCQMVIFGAAGDLTQRLVVPSLYNLARGGLLPEQFRLIAVDHNASTSEDWQQKLHTAFESLIGNRASEFDINHIDEGLWDRLMANAAYVHGEFDQPLMYEELRDVLAADSAHAENMLFYLAVPDRLFEMIVVGLDRAGLTKEPQQTAGEKTCWRRVVIEKPFGHSLESARNLNADILRTLREQQIFRIDHFLGKDTVQSIMALRFANGLFEPIWNRDRIDHVQITAAETIGIGTRGSFYEVTGALRDMVPSHLFNLLSMVAMEPPTGFDAAEIRNKRYELFRAIPTICPKNVVRGQYGAGKVQGATVKAYRQESRVAADSNTETYTAVRVEVDNWRWAGVPFYLRTGKRLSDRATEIAICFKQAPFAAFQNTPVSALQPNWLVLRIAPDQGISMQFQVKRPGPQVELTAVRMEFLYDDWFPKDANVGYESLLRDVMLGDQTLFMRADMVEESWRVVQPLLDDMAAGHCPITVYEAGSAGPVAADTLLLEHGRSWRPLEGSGRPKMPCPDESIRT